MEHLVRKYTALFYNKYTNVPSEIYIDPNDDKSSINNNTLIVTPHMCLYYIAIL